MSRGKWLLVVVGAAAFLLAVGVLGGGVYRTVNLGHGDAYLVNRFTGKAFPVIPREPEAMPDPAAEAISLVKSAQASEYFDFATHFQTVEDCVRGLQSEQKGLVPPLGWTAEKQPSGLYVVYAGGRHADKVARAFGWEVDVANRIVRFINDDPELAKHYGFADSGTSDK